MRLRPRDWEEVLGHHSTAVDLLSERWRTPRLLALDARNSAQALTHAHPTLTERLMSQAERVVCGRVELLGSGEVDVGCPPDWHRDFKSGERWPMRHISRLNYYRLDDGSDYKVPWELSRFHHGLALAQAFALTADHRWAHHWQLMVDDWLKANPVEFGINWVSPMDVAIRAVNWIAALELLAGAVNDEAFAKRLVESLFLHGRYVAANLEIHQGLHDTIANNHLLADLVGLAVLGAWFEHTRDGKRWLEAALDLLPREVERQVYLDGVAFEASIPYHRLTTELILVTAIQLERAQRTLPERVRKALHDMVSFTLAYTRDDGTSPVIGDADDGRLWWWILPRVDRSAPSRYARYMDFLDHRHVVALVAIWLKDGSLWHHCGPTPPEAYWMFGAGEVRGMSELPGDNRPLESQGFPNGGIYVLRDRRQHVVVDAGSHGQQGLGGHAHNDALHLELWSDGVAWLTDSGVGSYAPSLRLRNQLRGTRAHNTIEIDEQEQWPFDPRRPFLLPAGSAPRVLRWHTGNAFDWLEVVSDAYTRLAEPVSHRRAVLLDHQASGLAIGDEVIGEGRHSIRWSLHFGPDITITEEFPGGYVAHHKLGHIITLRHVDFSEGRLAIIKDAVSLSYGTLEHALTLEWTGTARAPVRLITTLVPIQPGAEDRLDHIWERHSILLERLQREADLQP